MHLCYAIVGMDPRVARVLDGLLARNATRSAIWPTLIVDPEEIAGSGLHVVLLDG